MCRGKNTKLEKRLGSAPQPLGSVWPPSRLPFSPLNMGDWTTRSVQSPPPPGFCDSQAHAMGCIVQAGHEWEKQAWHPLRYKVRGMYVPRLRIQLLLGSSPQMLSWLQGSCRNLILFKRLPNSLAFLPSDLFLCSPALLCSESWVRLVQAVVLTLMSLCLSRSCQWEASVGDGDAGGGKGRSRAVPPA